MGRPANIADDGAELSEHERLARVFRTLGEARRLQLLEFVLENGQVSQSELFRDLEMPQSRAAEHLNCLVWCGFLCAERSGRRLIYRIADDRAKDFVQLARNFLDENEAGLGSCKPAKPPID